LSFRRCRFDSLSHCRFGDRSPNEEKPVENHVLLGQVGGKGAGV
jgi:hypothetical protein